MSNQTRNSAAGLLTDDQYNVILGSCSGLCVVFSFSGLGSNVINVATFTAMGLRDGVTISFLFLSLFDLSFLMLSFCFGVSAGLNALELRYNLQFEIEPHGLFALFGNAMILINVTNTLTTTFLAVARCMCVAKPLHFRNTFSRSRTVAFNLGFATFAVAIYAPILANMGMTPTRDIATNKTRPTLWVSRNRKAIKDVVWVMINTALPLFTEAVIIICVFVMTSSLRTASRFRQTTTMSPASIPPPKIQINYPEKMHFSTITISDKANHKEQRVVQQVVLISSVYVICNTPKILFTVVTAIEPQFTLHGVYSNLCMSVYNFQNLFEIFNASVNTFIYYRYNTKFRIKLCQLVNIFGVH